METTLYTQKGTKAGSVNLSEKVFGVKWNSDLVHQVVTSMMSSRRAGTAHTKNRGEVRGGGKKPWQQKGTGRARHGSIRSPLWKGGGVTHGPRNDKNYYRAVPSSMKIAAVRSILSRKFKDGELLCLDALKLSEAKTKNAQGVFSAIGSIKGYESMADKKNNAALILMPGKDQSITRSFRNLGNVRVMEVRNINPVDLLTYKFLVLVEPESLKTTSISK
ncbi:MAG: 50S ribosomal protein L4 [Patescibacteria group bacterium]